MTARSMSCPCAASSRSRFATKTPRSGSSGPGYICETSRIRRRASAVGDLQDPEAHLVARPFTPEHVARSRGDRMTRVASVHPLPEVVEAREAHADAGLRVDRLRERVGVLPAEVPARDVQE